MDPISAAFELLVEGFGPVGVGLGGFGVCWILGKGLTAAGRGEGGSAAIPVLGKALPLIGLIFLVSSVMYACSPSEPAAPVPLGTTMEIPAGADARNPYAVSAPAPQVPAAPASNPYARK